MRTRATDSYLVLPVSHLACLALIMATLDLSLLDPGITGQVQDAVWLRLGGQVEANLPLGLDLHGIPCFMTRCFMTRCFMTLCFMT